MSAVGRAHRAAGDAGAVLEREQHLAALDEYLLEAAAGHGRLVLVSGEAGVGKSTLVDEFERRHPDEDWLTGACDGLFTPRPLGPVLDMAEGLPGDVVEGARSGSAREAVFAGVLDRISGRARPCVMVIEDIHWADEASLDLIRHLGRRIRRSRTLVVLTCRDDALAAHHRLARLVGEIGRQHTARRMVLAPLTTAGVTELCRRAGRDDEAPRLHGLTGGNPFFLTEMLRSPDAVVSTSVREAVLARLEPLSPHARAAAETAALTGLRMDPGLLERVADEGAAAVEELLGQGLLVADGTMTRFRHELVRLAVAEQVVVTRRSALHRRILDVLREDDVADDALLAFHAEGCGDGAAVMELAPRAAERAAALGSTREAVEQYRRALRFADDSDPAVRARLCNSLADVLSRLEEFESSLEVRQEALAHWRAIGDVRREADALRRDHWALSASRPPAEARETCRRAVDLLTPLGPSRELAWARAGLARVLMVQGALTESREWAAGAQSLAERLGLDDVLSDALNTDAAASAALGLEWEEPMARALALAREVPDAALVARADYNTVCTLIAQHRFAEAAAYYPGALEHAVEHDLDNYSRWLRREDAVLQLHLGRWDDAVAAARVQADESGESRKTPILPRVVVSLVTTRRGEGEDVDETLEVAQRSADFTGMHQYIVPVLLARAEVAWLRGSTEEAGTHLERARALGVEERWLQDGIELWTHRIDGGGEATDRPPAVALEIAGHPAEASRAWDERACPYDAALALLGSHEESHLREAVIRLEALGAVVPARLARQRMREHGYGSIPVDSRASTRAHPAGLTRREQEVLELVAAGLRNRDIADRLFLSPKTVAVHVSSVVRKLEVTTRGEAAAWFHRQDAG